VAVKRHDGLEQKIKDWAGKLVDERGRALEDGCRRRTEGAREVFTLGGGLIHDALSGLLARVKALEARPIAGESVTYGEPCSAFTPDTIESLRADREKLLKYNEIMGRMVNALLEHPLRFEYYPGSKQWYWVMWPGDELREFRSRLFRQRTDAFLDWEKWADDHGYL
jgi:hypothetical protein